MIGSRLPSFRGLFVLLTGEGCQRAISFIAIWRLTQKLGQASYAPVEVACAAMMFATLVVEMGFPLLGAREVARDPCAAAALVPKVVATQLGAALLLVASAFVASAVGWLDADLARLLPVYSLSLLALPFLLPWVFQGLGRMGWVAAPGVLRQTLFLLVTVLLVGGPGDLARLPWAEVGAVAAAAVVAQIGYRRFGQRLAIAPRAAFEKELVRAAVPMGISQLLWVLRMYLPTLLLWRLVARESVANYGIAHRVMMVMQALLTMYFTNLYPALSRAVRGPPAALRKLLLQSLLIAAGGTLAVALAIAAKAEGLLLQVFRSSYANAESAECLKLLALVIPVLAFRGHARMTLLSMGRARIELLCSVAGTLLLALLIPWWTHQRGVGGAALALLVAEVAGTVLTFLALWHALRATGRRHVIDATELP